MAEVGNNQAARHGTKALGRRREVLLVLLLVLLTAAVRVYLVHFTYCVCKDSVGYMFMAECLRQGEFAAFLQNVQHHLFPVVLFAVQEVMGTSLLAAHGLNVVLGTAGVVPFYLLARNVFGVRAAAASSMFFAFHVLLVRSAAAIVTEPLYLLAFLSGLYAGKRAIDRGGLFSFALSGSLLGVAFMARPEGLGLWAIVGGWVVLLGVLKVAGALILRREYEPSGLRLLSGVCVMAATAFLTITPHLLEVRLADGAAGRWRLTRKHDLSELARGRQVFSPSAVVPATRHTPRGEMKHLGECLHDLGSESLWAYQLPSLLPLFYVLGVICRRSQRRELLGELVLASVVLAYAAVALLFRMVHGYISERHLISSGVVALMWAGPGFWAARDWIARLIARWDKLEHSPARVTGVVLMLVALGTMSAKTLQPIGAERAYLPETGAKIRAAFPPPPNRMTKVVCFSEMPRTIFYAGGRPINAALLITRFEKDPERTVRALGECRLALPDLLLLRPGEPGSCDSDLHSILQRQIAPAFRLAYEKGDKAQEILAYRFADLPDLTSKGGKKGE